MKQIAGHHFDEILPVEITCIDRHFNEFTLAALGCYTREVASGINYPTEYLIPEGLLEDNGKFWDHKQISGITEDLEIAETHSHYSHSHCDYYRTSCATL